MSARLANALATDNEEDDEDSDEGEDGSTAFLRSLLPRPWLFMAAEEAAADWWRVSALSAKGNASFASPKSRKHRLMFVKIAAVSIVNVVGGSDDDSDDDEADGDDGFGEEAASFS